MIPSRMSSHPVTLSLAGGNTVSDYNLRDLERRGFLVAVNGSAAYTKPHAAITADMQLTAACHPLWVKQGVPEMWVRATALPRGFEACERTIIYEGGELADTSGLAGARLAILRATERVYLLGYDMIRRPHEEPYWYPSFPWSAREACTQHNLNSWTKQFDTLAEEAESRGVSVFNVSPFGGSLLTQFPRLDYHEFCKLEPVR